MPSLQMSAERVFRIWSARVTIPKTNRESAGRPIPPDHLADPWQFHDISGPDDEIKFDRPERIDLDKDGDLDVLTCEESADLGVIWNENRQ